MNLLPRFTALLLALLVAACSTPAVPLGYYTLAANMPSKPGLRSDWSLVVGPVSLPAAVDRTQLVERVDAGTRTVVADDQRWAGTLRSEFALRMAATLASASGQSRVVAAPQNSVVYPDYTLPIDVLRFDTDERTQVTLDAVWTLRHDGRDVADGRFTATEPTSERTWTAVVQAQGRLVDAMAQAVARKIPDKLPPAESP